MYNETNNNQNDNNFQNNNLYYGQNNISQNVEVNLNDNNIPSTNTNPVANSNVPLNSGSENFEKRSNKTIFIIIGVILLLIIIGFIVKKVFFTSSPNKRVLKENDKLVLIIGGNIDNGKAEFLSTITKKYGTEISSEQIKTGTEEKNKGIKYKITKTDINTGTRKYDVICPVTDSDFNKEIILLGDKIDTGIIVVSTSKGLDSDTINQIKLLNYAGVDKIGFFINNDNNSSQNDINLLVNSIKENGAQDSSIVNGNVTSEEDIIKIIDEMNILLKNKKLDIEEDFLFQIEDRFTRDNKTIVTGKVLSGKLNINDSVDLIGLNKDSTTKVSKIEMFKENYDSIKVDDNAGLTLEGISYDSVERGQVLSKPGSIKSYKNFEAYVYVMGKDESGKTTTYSNGYEAGFYFRSTDVIGKINTNNNLSEYDSSLVNINLELPLAMKKGTVFTIREGGYTTGVGIVTKTNY